MTVEKIRTAVIALQEGYGELSLSADITSTTEAPFLSASENGSIQNGIVRNGETTLARFSSANEQNLTVNYLTADDDARAVVQAAVSTFCKSARQYIGDATITVTSNTDYEN